MSQQENDKFIYKNKKYELISIESPRTFLDWDSFGLNPIELSTACWRGFINTFSVFKGHLVLDKIYTNNQTRNENEEMVTINIHEINGILPEIKEPDKDLIDDYKNYRIIVYNKIKYRMNYNGSLVIVKDYINDFESGPYAFLNISPFCYKHIIKLTFSEGNFVKETDFSEHGEKIRSKRMKSKNKKSAYNEWPELKIFYEENNM